MTAIDKRNRGYRQISGKNSTCSLKYLTAQDVTELITMFILTATQKQCADRIQSLA